MGQATLRGVMARLGWGVRVMAWSGESGTQRTEPLARMREWRPPVEASRTKKAQRCLPGGRSTMRSQRSGATWTRGWAEECQWLKSPTMATWAALGTRMRTV